MDLTIQLFATFRNGRFKEVKRSFADDMILGQVVAEFDIAESEIGMALVNGRHAAMVQRLNDNDIIALFPLLGGG